MKYFKFTAMAFLYSPVIILFLLHGSYLVIFLAMTVILVQVIFDNLLPKYTGKPEYAHTLFLNFLVYLQIPLSYFAVFVLLWQVAPGDLFGFGAWIESTTGLRIMEAHENFSTSNAVVSAAACGFYLSISTLIGHELTHRLDKPLDVFLGKLSLALVGDAQFMVSHVYAHHKNVATPLDAATARRGENLYGFVIRSALGQYRESWEFEVNRLKRIGKNLYSFSNQVVSGLLYTLGIAGVFYVFAGFYGVLCYTIFVLVAKFIFETVNYIEHYGLIRVPGTKVLPRHSWDCQNVMSTFNYLNLTRHSDHHANSRKPYWELEVQDTAVDLPYGYMAFILIALFPPLFHKVITPRLLEWDEQCASEGEKEIAYIANQKSGIAELMNSRVNYKAIV